MKRFVLLFLMCSIFLSAPGIACARAARKGNEMAFRQVGNVYVLRLNKGQEILPAIKDFCTEHKITAGTIQGIGVANDVTLGYFDSNKKAYVKTFLKGNYEITSMMGNISFVDSDLFIHLHINMSDDKFKVYGGHLLEGKIGLTGEIFIQSIDTRINRVHDADLGLNIMNP